VKLVIVGSEGNVGRRLMAAFPGAVGIDRVAGADIVADLMTIDYAAPDVRAAFTGADGVVHVGTNADPGAADAVHFASVTASARLVEACAGYGVPRLVLPSSGWADPKPAYGRPGTYGHSKRAMEALAAMYAATGRRAVALRIGWVPADAADVAKAPQHMQDDYWDDARLIAAFREALGI
jgi:nucleoside-diphosphate-sugar epimerase